MPRKDYKIVEGRKSKLGVGQEEYISPESSTISVFAHCSFL